jgi:AraC-like DNA-binding protein
MPSSAVHTFTDPDAYVAAVRGTDVEVTILGRGRFTAKLTRVDMHRLWTQRFSDNLPRVSHSAMSGMKGRAVVQFRTAPGPSLVWGCSEMHPTNIVRHSEGDSAFHRSAGSLNWASMSLPVEEMALLGATIAGCDLTPPKQALTLTPAPQAMARLQRLHAAAGRLAEDAPEIIAQPEAARGLEQALIQALVACLGEGTADQDTLAQRHHALIMRRFRGAVEENADQPLYIPELCTAIGVSDRTLRVCCQEQLGMSPKHYLLLRRMNLARRALRESSASETTVTEIATQYGFWQFGRFAGEYRALFGEAPSATLHRPRD